MSSNAAPESSLHLGGQSSLDQAHTATVIWHPDLHRQVAQEQLAFISLSLRPRYKRDLALQIIDRATAVTGVRSYVVWEQMRKPDLLMRAWLPPGKNSADLVDEMRREAGQVPGQPSELDSWAFDVRRTLAHHLWPTSLEQEQLSDALANGSDYLTSGQVFGPVPDLLMSLMKRRYVAPIQIDSNGIKFFVWLTVSDILPSDSARSHLESELVRVVNSVRDVYATSVYSGDSRAANYLVTGRFKPENYEVLAKELQPSLADLGGSFIAVNTDSSLSTLFGPIDRIEALLRSPLDSVVSVTVPQTDEILQILRSPESDVLEFKGSAFTPLDTDGRKMQDAEISGRTKKVRDAVIKSVSGFLNTRGGCLVIGVLESDRVANSALLQQGTQAGEYLVIGVDESVDGKPVTWDEFERRLRQLISDSIDPAPDPWVNIQRLSFEGMDVACLRVREPNTWFWSKTSTETDVFYVRYGNATQPLRGPAQRNHMRSLPRED